MPVQLRFAARLTGEAYVTGQGWLQANLDRCPAHPEGGCNFRRHTPYERNWPVGALIARWYCPEAHQTFSLLPDFLASRVAGPLADIEAVALAVEAGPSVEAVAAALRPQAELPGAVRWVRRRLRWVQEAISVARGLIEALAGTRPQLSALAETLGVPLGAVLVHLRSALARHLSALASPTGLCPRWRAREIAEVDFNNRRGRRSACDPP